MPHRDRIGIDDGFVVGHGEPMQEMAAAAQGFAELFRGVYLTFHRRDGRRNQLSGVSAAVLTHLAMAGPLTVGEAALHLDRAQSVVSEIIDGLVRRGLLEREPDPADRRRNLVWLTTEGHATLRRNTEVLDVAHLEHALQSLSHQDRCCLLRSLRTLIESAAPAAGQPPAESG